MVDSATVWVLFMNLPVNVFNDEGLLMIAQEVGIPVSAPVKGFVHGRRFVKFKIIISVEEPVKDFVKVTHPTLGQLMVYCSYEKISRICLFCGELGHEMSGCKDHARLALLIKKPGQEDRFNGLDLLAQKRGTWVTNPALAPGYCASRKIPAESLVTSQTVAWAGGKRRFERVISVESGSPSNLGTTQNEQHHNSGDNLITVNVVDGGLALNKRPRSAGPNAPAPYP